MESPSHQHAIIASPVGNIQLSLAGATLLGLTFTCKTANNPHSLPPSCLKITRELNHYFSAAHHTFICPLHTNGTPFQQRVWKALQGIPYGELLTYGQLAKQLNTSPRAIGNACRANPIPIIIPCHRIVGQKGLVGYSGDTSGPGLRIKQFLIDLEQNQFPKRVKSAYTHPE